MTFKTAFAALLPLALGACNTSVDESGQPTIEQESSDTAEATEPPPLPEEFARTAWRVQDEEGARYTTYLDPEGRYRDFRNGDPFQEGGWEVDEEGRICFTPEVEDGAEQCWRPDEMTDESHMTVTSRSGRRVRLERVDYGEFDVEQAQENE